MSKKLFTVSLEFEYYAYAESEEEAKKFIHQALDDVCGIENELIVIEQHPDGEVLSGWSQACLVYHSGHEDITVDQAWPNGKESDNEHSRTSAAE